MSNGWIWARERDTGDTINKNVKEERKIDRTRGNEKGRDKGDDVDERLPAVELL